MTSGRRFGKAKSLTSSLREEYRLAGKFNSTEGIGETKSTKSKVREVASLTSPPRHGGHPFRREALGVGRIGNENESVR